MTTVTLFSENGTSMNFKSNSVVSTNVSDKLTRQYAIFDTSASLAEPEKMTITNDGITIELEKVKSDKDSVKYHNKINASNRIDAVITRDKQVLTLMFTKSKEMKQ